MIIINNIINIISHAVNNELFLTISFFLDDCPFSCDVISKFFDRLMNNIATAFERFLSSDSKCESKEREVLYSAAKLALRVCMINRTIYTCTALS